MFEARILKGKNLKRLIESIKELVTDANFDCSSAGVSLQAMDSNHVSLVALLLKAEGFEHYRADRNISLGINLSSMSKILKCSDDDDIITLKAEDSGDSVTFMFESPKQTRISHFSSQTHGHRQRAPRHTHHRVQVRRTHAQRRVQAHRGRDRNHRRHSPHQRQQGRRQVRSQRRHGHRQHRVQAERGSGRGRGRADTDQDGGGGQSLTFALRYLNSFAKATPLAKSVSLKMSPDVPLVVEYQMEEDMGHIRYYLAPKIDEEEEGEKYSGVECAREQ